MKQKTTIAWCAGAVVAIGLTACGSDDDEPVPTVSASTCAGLATQSIGGAAISATAMVPAAAASGAAPAVPEYCKVTAQIAPKLNFEMRLPVSWNGKLHYGGGGGFNGSIPAADNSALNQGYVDVSSDSGHTGTSALDGSFALGDPVALRLFSRLSVPTVAAAAKQITESAYGAAPTRSYFEGCSNGGREGLMTALRFPTMFDGVIAKAPAKFVAPIENYQRTARLLARVPGSTFTSAKLTLLSSSLMASCDALDGVSDGIISNIAACRYDASVLRCPSGGDESDSCLSDAQINVVASATSRMTGGAGTPNVTSHSPFALLGEIAVPGGWASWIIGNPASTITGLFGASVVKNLLGGDPAANWVDYDFKANAAIVQAMADEIDVTDPNMTSFRLTGAKLLLWHGAADAAVPLQSTIDYYDAVKTAAGGQAAMDSFSRLYVSPGVQHCGGGTGADQSTSMLPALDAWVTQNTAPGDLTTKRVNSSTGATVLSRPLCRYPTFPRYKGSGDVNDAANYTCATS
ncbi:MAG TPA: tannase/feruloyl esterase family alpha/beta hydrolase [Rubrivivax sp.]|nr:tannase/feruloyl esterase family alpha/beta hydrolase [Rubrivivax sp.]